MSGDEARPNQTETAKYLAAFISPQFSGKTINLGSGKITTTDYTIQEETDPYNSTPALGIDNSSGGNAPGLVIQSSAGTNTICGAIYFNAPDKSNAGLLSITTGSAAHTVATDKLGTGTVLPLNITPGSAFFGFNTDNSLNFQPTADPTPSAGNAGSIWNSSTNAGIFKYCNSSAVFNIVATRATSQQTSVTNAAPTTVSFTPPAQAGIYRISGYLNVTTGTTIAAALKVTYKDPEGNARNDGVVFQKAGSATLLTSVVTTGQQTFHETIAIDNSGTAITVADNAGTYTTCVYDLAVVIERLA